MVSMVEGYESNLRKLTISFHFAVSDKIFFQCFIIVIRSLSLKIFSLLKGIITGKNIKIPFKIACVLQDLALRLLLGNSEKDKFELVLHCGLCQLPVWDKVNL